MNHGAFLKHCPNLVRDCEEAAEVGFTHQATLTPPSDDEFYQAYLDHLAGERQANQILSENLLAMVRENARLRTKLAHRRNFRAWAFWSIPVIGLLGLALILKIAFEG